MKDGSNFTFWDACNLAQKLYDERKKVPSLSSDELFNKCIKFGADRAEVAAWPDFKRREYLISKLQ